jgi:pimeloyl-ACP methyl ester carboxylesterase
VVAGHSYGGQIIAALGTDTPNVVGLVYIAAFGLDEGESIGALLDQAPAGPALAHLDVDQHGFAWLAEGDFVNIPPDAQRLFAPRMGATTVEVSTNHVAMVFHPDEVLQLIKTAAEAVPAATQIGRLRLNCGTKNSSQNDLGSRCATLQ